ncbi:hypothetical protein [Mogibacterium timidum]
MSKKKAGFKKDGKYYVYCKDHYEEVSRDVYCVIMDEVWREEKKKQRGWRCRDGRGYRCSRNCEECDLYRYGEGPAGSDVSLDQMYEESDFEVKGSDSHEDAVILKIVLDTLIEELNGMVPDAERIVDMLKADELEKDVAKELGIAKTTLNYRKNKVVAFLREHLKDFI